MGSCFNNKSSFTKNFIIYYTVVTFIRRCKHLELIILSPIKFT